ncbi:MAG: calcium/sodium antiporter [Gammaproteobacteria bacterium]|nr:calcium/sodium antiporter [Gammaproteobacteria bacterium]
MLLPTLAVLAGFAALTWGADRFVLGAAATARNLGVPTLVGGLTVVGFGTSAPEILVSATAAWQDNTQLAVGNALGSNITNIALVLGATALIAPLRVHSGVLKREFPVLMAIMLFTLALLTDGRLDRHDGLLLLAGLAVVLYWMVSLGLRARHGDPIQSEYAAEIPATMPLGTALAWVALGLLVLLGSARLLVWGAVQIATALGVSDLVIGLTVVAIGTSLPELAASVVSALKHEHDIAIGNIIGSNMYNLLAVLGLPALIQPVALPDEVLMRDYPVMIVMTLGLFAMAYGFRGEGRITRVEGGILLASFAGYQYLLFHTA